MATLIKDKRTESAPTTTMVDNETLREMVDNMGRMEAFVDRVKKAPQGYGTILAVSYREGTYHDFHEGMKVRLKAGVRGPAGVGTIPEGGINRQAVVNFTGASHIARIGHADDRGVIDIEPVGIKFGGVKLAVEGRTVEVPIPDDLEFEPGNRCLVLLESLAITRILPTDATGALGTVDSIVDGQQARVLVGNDTRLVYYTTPIAVGDQVAFDPTGQAVVKNLGPIESDLTLIKDTGVTWEHIGGQDAACAVVQEAISDKARHAPLYRAYRKKPVKGILLFGAAGNGKTMIGKAAATQLAHEHGEGIGSGLVYVSGPEVLSKWVGEAERTVRELFQQARDHKAKHGYPAVIFIDEAEALLSERGSSRSSDVDKTIVPTFLAQMDGMEESGALVILATNKQDVLDPAVVRPGRVDRHVRVGSPDQESATTIFAIYLSELPLAAGLTARGLARIAAGESYSARHVLEEVRCGEETLEIRFGDLMSGALIAAIVDKATDLAIERDRESGVVSGVTPGDLTQAVAAIMDGQRDLNHRWAIEEKAAGRKIDQVRKVSQRPRESPGTE